MGLEEHACCVGYGLRMIDIGNGYQWPILRWRRSRVEIASGNVQVRSGVDVNFDEDSNKDESIQIQFNSKITISEFFFIPPGYELMAFFSLDAIYIEETSVPRPQHLVLKLYSAIMGYAGVEVPKRPKATD